ncbi:RNA polymerase sigma factor [Eubacterium ventriosum]|uniref:RNA polymerase sigma factor n=1 Tax=Eubacterium ventriosum TaxID=39496 RepID=UPI0039924A6B
MDTNRYADLVNMYANNVYKIAVSYCNNRSDAEDIVQNVFIKLLKSKEKFKDDEHVKRWLIRVAINESKNMNTSFWRKRIVPLEDPEPIINTRDKSDEKAVLLGAVMKLKEKNRIVVQLYYYEGYSVKEIAEILRIKETTVQTRLMRARNALREIVKEDWLNE